MSDSSQNQICQALAEPAHSLTSPKPKRLAAIRVSPGGYFAVAAFLTFVSLILLRTHRDLAALILIIATWTVIPPLVFTDRLNFDGERIFRSGFIAWLARIMHGRLQLLSIEDVERVDVMAMRTLRRGGSVRYRYRVEITGRERTFVFTSGGERFRRLVKLLLPRISWHKLDSRAGELCDHLADSKAVRQQAAQLGIASDAVLEETTEAGAKRARKDRRTSAPEISDHEAERARLLRKAANELRVAGRLRESAEAFRRTLLITARDPWLIYEYARLLRSQASALGEARVLTRALAALQLAAKRGANDARLLERLGESFLEYGAAARATKSFRQALTIDERAYRAQLGLAEVALSEGKLAHVIHHYNDAARIAPDKATARLARREADYYTRLNFDEDYLAAELRRMNWLENANRVQSLAARASFASLLMALIGSSVNQVLGSIGWAFASSSIIAWSGALILARLLATRGRVAESEV